MCAARNALGYKADTVSNGAEALSVIESTPYDLIFMDCEMPVMDGYEATRRIRRSEAVAGGSHTPIVALTAHAISGDMEECMAAGMDGYLSKPIDLGRLSDALAKWLSVPLLGCRSASEVSIPVESGARIFNQQELLDRLMNDRSLAARVLDEFLRDAPLQLGNLAVVYCESGSAVVL